jgi:hypothetical protein
MDLRKRGKTDHNETNLHVKNPAKGAAFRTLTVICHMLRTKTYYAQPTNLIFRVEH